MENPSVLLYGPLKAKIEDRPVPEIRDPYDVVVRVAYTGVCGSDVHFWLNGGIRTYVSEEQPLTMGHEASGTIFAIGTKVTTLVPGDRVAIEPGYPCRRCVDCKAGRYNLCPSMKFAADPPFTHGTLCKYFLLPADFCYKLHDNISFGEGVLMEPLAVGVHSVRQANIRPGQRVVIFGAGTVGLMCAAAAREFGASKVAMIDVFERKLEFALSFLGSLVGRVSTPNREFTPEQNAEKFIKDFAMPEGPDIIIDASGAEVSVQTAMHLIKRGGTYVQTGMGKRTINFPISEVCEKELTVKGCFRYGAGDFDLSISLVSQGKIKVKSLITKVLPFEEATEAWETTKRGEGIKTLIEGVKD
ncbi:chaperonin 10-like protein [Lipomyces oligophaga]|uniref:chaperonin 10-like protein n=1 Tax=Lipomyces oligophaga TaxID=45792 RepID=UPI0034CF1BC1